jgi:hypothetical protein
MGVFPTTLCSRRYLLVLPPHFQALLLFNVLYMSANGRCGWMGSLRLDAWYMFSPCIDGFMNARYQRITALSRQYCLVLRPNGCAFRHLICTRCKYAGPARKPGKIGPGQIQCFSPVFSFLSNPTQPLCLFLTLPASLATHPEPRKPASLLARNAWLIKSVVVPCLWPGLTARFRSPEEVCR